tara:strand:+ start:379 stop:582 length:204 start_codon:yes stop_codon:yes gene_type:complete
MKIKDLLKKNVKWKSHPTARGFFYYKHDEKIFLLRMNNFPDEVLYTIINGIEIIDIEDKPTNWELGD